jgi:2,3-bisphosphoglycerate-dependent phosphoglycerate mutase
VELLLIRHGLPDKVINTDGTAPDPPLSHIGLQQAQKVGEWLANQSIDAVVCSPLLRAQQTAAPLGQALNLTPIINDGIAEFATSSTSYVPLEELKRDNYPLWRARMESGWFSSQDPEVFKVKVVEAMEGIIDAHPGERVAVFCHAGVINIWAGHVIGARRYLFFEPAYTSIHRFGAGRQGQRGVLSLNEQAHLHD